MIRYFLILTFITQISFLSFSQDHLKLDDFGRITLNTYVSDQVKIPAEAKIQLENKLKQIASNYGMSGTGVNPRFIITASISVISKDIIAGPPQMIAQKMDVTLFIGDAIDNKIFTNTVISTKGVGTNENKSFIDGLMQLNTKSEGIQKFMNESKIEMISYYKSQCELVMKKGAELSNVGKFSEALYELSLIPDVCEECFSNAQKQSLIIFQQKIDSECQNNLNQAKAVWSSSPNYAGASMASDYLSTINVNANCYPEVKVLYKVMSDKLVNDEKIRQRLEEENAKREFELTKQREKQDAELEKERIQAYKEAAIEYAKRQPSVIYRNIYWY